MMKMVQLFLLILLFSVVGCDPETLFRSAPVVDDIILEPQIINPFDTVYAEVKATNPEEGTLSYQWTVSPEAGFFIDPADRAVTRWIAPTVGGTYTFTVQISNSFKSAERSGSVRVVELGKPLVRILKPQEGDYVVQLSEIEIKAEAYHNNGLQKIQLFVEDRLIAEKSGTAVNQYTFFFVPDTSYLGLTEIKLEAISNYVFTTGADSVTVNIEGIVPGRGSGVNALNLE